MKVFESHDARRAAMAQAADWPGIGWSDSSWDLAHGLEVVEDLPADAWTAELARQRSTLLRTTAMASPSSITASA